MFTPKTICCSRLFSNFYRFNFLFCIFHVLHHKFIINIFSKLLITWFLINVLNFLFLSFHPFISTFYFSTFLLSTFSLISFSNFSLIFFSNFSPISFFLLIVFLVFFIFLLLNSSINACTLPT